MKKFISITVLVGLVISAFYFFNHKQAETTISNESLVMAEQESNRGSVNKKNEGIDKKPSVSELNKFPEIYDKLKPIKESELEIIWEEAYGCYDQGLEEVPDDVLMSSDCKSPLLTASSFEEAVWMQRQGYPDKFQLEMLKDVENVEKIRQLAEEKYPPALNLMSVYAFEHGHYKNAMSWALRASAYSDSTDTFPIRIHGEAMVNGDFFELGLAQLKVADYLGDSEAGSLFLQLTSNSSLKAGSAIENANLIMARRFNVPFNQYPRDPRPDGGNGG